MNNTFLTILGCVACAGAGFAAGYFIEKNHYEKIINTEINDSVEYFQKKYEDLRKEVKESGESSHDEEDEEPLTTVHTSLEGLETVKQDEMTDYTNVATMYKVEEVKHDGPYSITPNQYDGHGGVGPDVEFDKRHMTYYEGDDVFTDENDEIVAEGESLIGVDNLDKFGEYEEDVLYIRNEKTSSDYEVFLDRGEYGRYN